MKILSPIITALLLSLSAPVFACGPYGGDPPPEPPPSQSALLVTGSASQLDERTPSAPVLYVAYPVVPGQTGQHLYGDFFTMARDASYDRLANRLAKGQAPRVVLARASTESPWRVAAFLPAAS